MYNFFCFRAVTLTVAHRSFTLYPYVQVDDSVNSFVTFYDNYHTYIWLAGIFLAALLVLHCCVVPLCLPCAVCYNCVKGCQRCFCCCASKRGGYSKQRNQEC